MFLAFIVLVLAAALASFAAPEPASPKVQVDLVSEVESIPAGETFWVALHQRIAAGWHTYWITGNMQSLQKDATGQG